MWNVHVLILISCSVNKFNKNLTFSFKPQTRKYHLVAPDVQRQRGVADLEFDLHTDIQSLLDKEIQSAFADMVISKLDRSGD